MFRRPTQQSSGGEPRRGRIKFEDIQQLRRLFRYTKPYRRQLWLGLIASAFSAGAFLIFPLIAGRLFNVAFGAGGIAQGVQEGLNVSGRDLNMIGLALIVVFIVQAIFNFIRVYNLALVGEGVVADLRRRLYEHLLGLSVRFFESRKTGEITSRLTSDISTVQNVVSNSLSQFINQSITLIGGLVVLFVLNLKLTLVMLSIFPAVILAAAYFGRKLRKISTEFQDKVAAANADAEEAITGIRVVKSFTAEGLESNRYSNRIQDSYDVAVRRARVRAFFVPSIFMAFFVGIGIVLWYGGRLILSAQIQGGDLITFLLLTVSVAGSIGAFTGLYSQFQEALGASKRIFELLDTQTDLPEVDDVAELESSTGNVRFENVAFNYGDRGEDMVLADISLDAKSGEVIALVGPSGAGKSTLITLIPRFYDPIEGRILLDDVDIRDLALDDLRGNIGIVPQETQLFSGTIAENIRYGKQGSSDEEVEVAAQAANAHNFILEFPDGYETVVGERGVKLSGGQRQRIAIARALLKNPRILILDEATSSLDSESEALVQDALELLMKGRTTFVIAHRLSTIQTADRILVLDDGRIVEQGSHQTLLDRGGLYRDLHEKQFRNIEMALAS